MTFTNVLLVCLGGIAACAALVFAVETLVAFCFHEQDDKGGTTRPAKPALVERNVTEMRIDRAA
jgi:hypothetical protein